MLKAWDQYETTNSAAICHSCGNPRHHLTSCIIL
jgi:hypothetical protein